jgi:DNA-binding GntR family transcriptional regulator
MKSIAHYRPMKRTRVDHIRADLADRIARRILPPGTSLEEARLASEFGVSRTPIREVLRQLEAMGLVEARPHRGAVVAQISEIELNERFQVMAELEAVCANYAALNMTEEDKRALQAIHRDMHAAMIAGDTPLYEALNDRFHEAIYCGTHNTFLMEITLLTRQRVAPFRHAQFSTLERPARSYAEHDLIVAAILKGDSELAAQRAKSHIGDVRRAFDALPDPALTEA